MITLQRNVLFFILIICNGFAAAQNKNVLTLEPGDEGFIPGWVAAGPFEFPMVGFGNPKDTTAIGEPDISPSAGDYSESRLPETEKVQWFLQGPDSNGYIDFNSTMQWNVNTSVPVKIWYSKAGYAYTTIHSESDKEALLTVGSNSQIKVFLNKKEIYNSFVSRNAQKDQDTVRIRLNKGTNELLVRVGNTHTNLGLAFFGVVKWEWGFYARLLEKDGKPLTSIKYQLKNKSKGSDFNLVSTIFYKRIENRLMQRYDLELNSLNSSPVKALLKLKGNEFKFDSVRFGKTRHSIYIPEQSSSSSAEASLLLGSDVITKKVELLNRKKYTVHLMLLNHTDVGYTHPQPVCEELHCNTLDEVIKTCKEHPDFKWTMETTWQLEVYEKMRSEKQFNELISLIKSGRIALSPIYTNPFTGLVSEEEMLRSFDKAINYSKKYGFSFNGAVYNDVPGQSWFLPQALSKAGVKLVAEGINEVYGDYKLQRSLPKVFNWEAADGSRVITYLNEAYNEGRSYGLESGDLFTVEQNLWERITKLESRDYPPDIILINSSFSDNSILPKHQYDLAMKWNREYEYPKFISSNINEFTDALINSPAYSKIPFLKGDWTSNWDIFYQGEYERNKKVRRSQHQLLSAEKLSTLSVLLDITKRAMNDELDFAYKNLLHFTGHGSGLEYGYGSLEENKLTMDYRDNYIENALLGAESVILKSMQMISKPEESLESEGLMVFNTLSWKRDDLVEFHFPFDTSPAYDVVDAATNQVIPSYRKDHRQYFIAREVPSLGYKKFLLKPGKSNALKSELAKSNNSIENRFYKITYDPAISGVSSIIDKKSGKELISNKSKFEFGKPAVERFQLKENYSTISGVSSGFEVIDESPVRIALKIINDNNVIETLEFSLLDGVDKVYLTATVNLANLSPVQNVEEYGIPFSFAVPSSTVKSEILGGYIDQNKDRLPGIDHDGVSVRRSVSVFNHEQSVSWASADARVIRIRKDETTGNQVIISNLVNNFPLNWNRHEDSTGRLEFRYSFVSDKGSFNPAATAKTGHELNTPFQHRKSWFRPLPSEMEFMNIDNPAVSLLNLKAGDYDILLRLINYDSERPQQTVINSSFFNNTQADIVDLAGNNIQPLEVKKNSIAVSLKPGEFTDILIKRKKL